KARECRMVGRADMTSFRGPVVESEGFNIESREPLPDAAIRQRCAVLTARERQVLEVLASGATTDESASRLRIAPDEVRARVQSSLRTLQARSKLEAVLIALRAGVIREDR